MSRLSSPVSRLDLAIMSCFKLVTFLTLTISLTSAFFVQSGFKKAYPALTPRFTLSMVTKVALTREAGANEKLAKLLDGLDTVEIPCIMFADGEDADKLPGALKSFDIVVITSPQAASVFIDAWMKAGKPTDIKIATVGKGTSKPLISNGLKIDFEPSDSTAETLALELPASLGKTVLYPSSSLAQETLASGLMERGFEVTRMNTYTTVPAIWTKEEEEIARSVDIVTFASPSAVKMWAAKVGTDAAAVVIGPTSAKAATSQGFKRVFAPEGSKGVEAWADVVKKVAAELSTGVL